MAIQALKGIVSSWYTPDQDDAEEDPTRFMLSAVNSEHLDIITEDATISDGVVRLTARGVRYALRYGIEDWENFIDEQKKEIPFSLDNFKIIPWGIRRNLASEIVNRSFLLETERKNS